MTGPDLPSPAGRRQALRSVVAYLRCPVCDGQFDLVPGRLTCRSGHSFDIARQGYVNLLTGRAPVVTGDTATMVESRERFLRRGHYQVLAQSLAALAAQSGQREEGLVVDLGAGTGYYLAQTLEALPRRHGLCVDLSAPALRRAAHAHPRAAAVGADVWQHLPLAARSAALVLSVFAPRNPAEISRILTPGGTLLLAAPEAGHLREILGPLGMIGIDQHKERRLAASFGHWAKSAVRTLSYQMSLDHADLAALVAMGPSARHIAPETISARIRDLPSPAVVSIDVRITAYRRREPRHG